MQFVGSLGNTAVGLSALMQNTNSYNTAIGTRAGGTVSSTGQQNILIGHQAGQYVSSGRNNLLIENIDGSSITTGSYNIILNPKQKSGVTTGSNNTIIGSNSGSTLTTASNNTIIGANITSLSAGLLNNIIISDGSGNIRISSDDLGRIGIGTTIPTEKLHVVGNIIATGTITPSDIRIKENILDTVHGLKEINLLQPKTYNIKSESQTGTDYTKERIGFLAQDIETVFGTKAITEYDHMYSEPQLVSLKDYDNYNDSEYIKRIDIQNIYEDIPFVENGVPMTKKELVSTVTNYYIDGIKGLKSPDQMYIIASLVNAVKELNQQLIDLKSVNNLL